MTSCLLKFQVAGAVPSYTAVFSNGVLSASRMKRVRRDKYQHIKGSDMERPRISRRRLLRHGITWASLTALAGTAYTTLVEPGWIDVSQVSLHCPGWPPSSVATEWRRSVISIWATG